MTCSCNQAKEQDDNGNDHDCPEGQHYDADAGKCVGEMDHDKDKKKDEPKKEQIGDSQAASTQGELADDRPGEQTQQVDPATCPEGQTWDADSQICIPTDHKDPGDGQTAGTDKTASIEKSLRVLNTKVDRLYSTKEKKKPIARVSNNSISGNQFVSVEDAVVELKRALNEGRDYKFHIPLEYFRVVNVAPADNTDTIRHGGVPLQEVYRGNNTLKLSEAYRKPNKTIRESMGESTLKEVVSISGTHATQDLDTDVAIVPGGITFVPVFQFAKVKQVEQGFDRARFFKTTLPATGTQTVGSTSTEATQTLTSVEVTPSLITGVYLVADYDEIENSPFDLIQAIVEASAAVYDDFVATDMLDIVSAEGTLTPGLWIRGDSGATITASDQTSAVALDETGVVFAREYLEDQGYLRGGIKPVLALHPQQWRELITSTNVTSLATRSVPDIWLKAQLEEFMGVQLVVTNAINAVDNQTADAYNALMFVPKHTFGIAVKRDVTVKFHDIGEDNQVRINTSWRTKSGVIDANSTVRISTGQ